MIIKMRYSVVVCGNSTMLRLAVPLLGLTEFSLTQDISNAEDIRVLSELPIDKLLFLQSGFVIENDRFEGNDTEDIAETRAMPHAMALHGTSSIKDRGGNGGGHYYYEEYYDKSNKKNKIQKLFQLTVTSLAFLAFGGYLLCLLIHAIKGKQTYQVNPAMVQTFATYVATQVTNNIKNNNKNNNKRPRKRRKNLKLQKPNRPNQGHKKPKRKPIRRPLKTLLNRKNGTRNEFIYSDDIPRPIKHRFKREVYQSGGFLISDDMYYSLLHLSEAYTKYNTFDYLYFNKTTVYGF